MIADILNNKQPNTVVTELLIRGRKLSIFSCFFFLMQSYSAAPKKY